MTLPRSRGPLAPVSAMTLRAAAAILRSRGVLTQRVAVVGVGGVGINSVQCAASAGARFVIAIDPVEFKRDKAKEFGATHTFASLEEALPVIGEITWGKMADVTVITVGEIHGDIIQPALSATGKGGQVVVGHPPQHPVHAAAGERFDGGDAAFVDQPVVVGQCGRYGVGGVGAAQRHLLDAQIGPVGEVRVPRP